MRPMILAACACGLLGSAASADTQTQTIDFNYNINDGVIFPQLDRFDTMGGTRQLNSVKFEFHHVFELALKLESTGPTPIKQGDFSLSAGFNSIFQLGEVSDENPNPPAFGPGGAFFADISADLDAYDGIPGNDAGDMVRLLLSDSYVAQQTYTDAEPDVLAAVTGVGKLTTVLGGFSELFFFWINDPGWPASAGEEPQYPSDAALWADWSDFRHSGQIVITYDYAPVPAPMTAAPLVLLAMGGRRRR